MELTGIHNARIVTPNGIVEGALTFDGERIAALATKGLNGDKPNSGSLNARGRYVLPGVVDPEVHLASNRALDEDFESETKAAIAAGVTTTNLQQTTHTLFDSSEGRPSPEVSIRFSEVVENAIALGRLHSWTDFSLSPLLMSEEQAKEIPFLAGKYGITTYKLYMHMRMGREHLERAWPQAPLLGVQAFDDALVYEAMRRISELGENGLLSLHCENWEIARVREAELRSAGRTDVGAWAERSPGYLEAMHVAGYGLLAFHMGCRVHVQHVSALESLPVMQWLRNQGCELYGQTGVHYLVMDSDQWKLNTPVRGEPHRQHLWEGLSDGVIDAVGSDHVNRNMAKEDMRKGNVWEDVSGFPSRIEAHLPLLLSEGVNKGRLSLERLAEVTAFNPARIWGLLPEKGQLQVGSHADAVVVDLNEEYVVEDGEILSTTGWSVYSGMRLKGRPVATVIRGRLVAERQDGGISFAPSPGGDYLHRSSGH